jgi:hypothetical protein
MIVPKNVTVGFTVHDIDWQVAALMMGCSVLDLIPTPQNRDAWRRGPLQKADA